MKFIYSINKEILIIIDNYFIRYYQHASVFNGRLQAEDAQMYPRETQKFCIDRRRLNN